MPVEQSIADLGANAANFVLGVYTNNSWSIYTPVSRTDTNITFSVPGSKIDGIYQLAEVNVPPVIISQPANQCACSTADASFKVSSLYATGFQWQYMAPGAGIWENIAYSPFMTGSTTDSLALLGTTPVMAGTQYRCAVYNHLDTVYSNAVTLSVGSSAAIAVQITNNTSGPICPNTPVVFTASIIGSAVSPSYQWIQNGIPVGNNSSQYTLASIGSSDTITCMVIAQSNVSATSIPFIIAADTVFTWTGAVNNLWSVPGNWSCGNIPTASTHVIIPAGAIVFIDSAVAQTQSLHIYPGASMSFSGFGNTLTINGTYQNDGSFSITNGFMILGTP